MTTARLDYPFVRSRTVANTFWGVVLVVIQRVTGRELDSDELPSATAA